jgi:hypothetical protein
MNLALVRATVSGWVSLFWEPGLAQPDGFIQQHDDRRDDDSLFNWYWYWLERSLNYTIDYLHPKKREQQRLYESECLPIRGGILKDTNAVWHNNHLYLNFGLLFSWASSIWLSNYSV